MDLYIYVWHSIWWKVRRADGALEEDDRAAPRRGAVHGVAALVRDAAAARLELLARLPGERRALHAGRVRPPRLALAGATTAVRRSLDRPFSK